MRGAVNHLSSNPNQTSSNIQAFLKILEHHPKSAQHIRTKRHRSFGVSKSIPTVRLLIETRRHHLSTNYISFSGCLLKRFTSKDEFGVVSTHVHLLCGVIVSVKTYGC